MKFSTFVALVAVSQAIKIQNKDLGDGMPPKPRDPKTVPLEGESALAKAKGNGMPPKPMNPKTVSVLAQSLAKAKDDEVVEEDSKPPRKMRRPKKQEKEDAEETSEMAQKRKGPPKDGEAKPEEDALAKLTPWQKKRVLLAKKGGKKETTYDENGNRVKGNGWSDESELSKKAKKDAFAKQPSKKM
jgi:hypothetical protein